MISISSRCIPNTIFVFNHHVVHLARILSRIKKITDIRTRSSYMLENFNEKSFFLAGSVYSAYSSSSFPVLHFNFIREIPNGIENVPIARSGTSKKQFKYSARVSKHQCHLKYSFYTEKTRAKLANIMRC